MERTQTRLQRQIERHLDGGLANLVAERRGAGIGWRAIATEIEQRTGVEVSHQALRDWFGADSEAVAP